MLLIILTLLAQNLSIPGAQVPRAVSSTDQGVLELADRNSYVMGPGDKVTVVVAGGSSEYLLAAGVSPWAQYTVGGDGYLSVAGVGAISVNGLTIAEAQSELQRRASSYFPSVTVTLSLQEPRSLRVGLGGMVNHPGTYVLTALDRVSGALELAGGISSFGSRSGVMITQDGDSLPIDLNMVPGTATYVSDPFLRNNADVMMFICSDPVYILSAAGSIETRDVRPDEDVEGLLSRMGGIGGNVDLRSSVIIRRGDSYPVWSDLAGFNGMVLQSGDTVMMVSIRDSVMVGGAVSMPGPVPYNPEYTAADYIISAGGPVSSAGGNVITLRNGRPVGPGSRSDDFRPMPGDVIEVKYSWFERNDALISLITSAISLGITLYAVSNN